MNYYIISSFINAAASIFCCIFVLINAPKSKTSRGFVYFSFFVFLWALFYFCLMISTEHTPAVIFGRLLHAGSIFIPVALFQFSCHLTNNHAQYARIIAGFYIFNCIFLPVIFTPLFLTKTGPLFGFRFFPSAGPLYWVILFEFISLVSASLYLQYRKLKVSSGAEQTRLKIVFYGLVIGFLGGGMNFLPICNIPVMPIGNCLVSLYVIAVTYTIFKYRFMDIQIIIKRSLVYTILITLITLSFFLAVYFIEHELREFLGYKSFFLSLLFATFISLAFIPLRNLIQGLLEKYFFKGSIIEITEENELLRQEIIATEKFKAVATLASGMAHEIKNPLTAIKTFSEYLPAKMNDKEFLEKFAPIIHKEANRIDTLVHELLDFAKPAPVQLVPSDIHKLLDDTIDVLSNNFIKGRIKIDKDYETDLPAPLNLDNNQFKQALLNILLNAIDAMPSGGVISIITRRKRNGSFVIHIQDSGTGITPSDLPHIFDPFFSRKDHGTGLGLSITHEIIKNHNGKITVTSRPKRGSTFTITLPLAG